MLGDLSYIEIPCDCCAVCGILRFYKSTSRDDMPCYFMSYYNCGYYQNTKIPRDSTTFDLTLEQIKTVLNAIVSKSILHKETIIPLRLPHKKKFYYLHFGPHACTIDFWLTTKEHTKKDKECLWEVVSGQEYITQTLLPQAQKIFEKELQKGV